MMTGDGNGSSSGSGSGCGNYASRGGDYAEYDDEGGEAGPRSRADDGGDSADDES